MTRRRLFACALCICLASLIAPAGWGRGSAAGAVAGEMGISQGRDLDALLAKARETFPLQECDAVLLLENLRLNIAGDGTTTTRVHRVVWIGTAVGTRAYADLRVPWNGADSRLDVQVLRTWRDGRWWPDPTAISETAVVETLPHAAERADDSHALRETMLLHDGVEPPCILETAYTITERGLPGCAGMFRFPQRDPAVLVELEITAPQDGLVHAELNGAPAPVTRPAEGMSSRLWTMSPAPALRLPIAAQPEAYEPAVAWSTWADWPALTAHLRAGCDRAAASCGALADTLATMGREAPDPGSLLRSVLALVEDGTRRIDCDPGFWLRQPRSAERIWETAYGNDLERAVLAMAALRAAFASFAEAGGAGMTLRTGLAVVAGGPLLPAADVPRLADLRRPVLAVGIPEGDYFWCPQSGLHAQGWADGRCVVALDGESSPRLADPRQDMMLEASLTLRPGEDGAWDCEGVLAAAGLCDLQGKTAGQDRSLDEALQEAAGSLLGDLKVADASPRAFGPRGSTVAFGGRWSRPEPDDGGCLRISVGAPEGGVRGRLPADVHIYDETRASPVQFPPAAQRVQLRMQLEDLEAVSLPAGLSIVNEAGSFLLECEVEDGWLTYRRVLQVQDPRSWPALRVLLAEEGDPANGTILLRERTGT